MAFVSLKKFGYQNPNEINEEIKRRKDSPATLNLQFDKEQYFLVFVPEIVSKLEDLLITERETIPKLLASFQADALNYAVVSMLIREVRSTHEIEGVHSSRREVEESAIAIKEGHTVKRFSEFFEVLSEVFTNDNVKEILTLEDIRNLYDRVTAGELEPNTDLDGVLFRTEPVYVRSESQKVLHTGFTPETRIMAGLEDMLNQAKNLDFPKVFNALLCHFMFETVHPFYDGNGRTGRVLLAYHLKSLLHDLTILSLSQAISKNKNLYYSALKDARDYRNHGELTGFILDMLGLIQKAQHSLISDLRIAWSRISLLKQNLRDIPFDTTDVSDVVLFRSILFQVGQHYIFGSSLGLSLPELSANLPQKRSEKTIRKYCQHLVDAGFLKPTTKRPIRFTLTGQGANLLDISEQLFQ